MILVFFNFYWYTLLFLEPHFDPLYLWSVKIHNKYVGILHKENYIGNLKDKKRLQSRLVEQSALPIYKSIILTPLGFFFFYCVFPIQKKIRGPSNEHTYQAWFELTKLLQRRLKRKITRTTMTTDDNGWSYLTLPFGPGKSSTVWVNRPSGHKHKNSTNTKVTGKIK